MKDQTEHTKVEKANNIVCQKAQEIGSDLMATWTDSNEKPKRGEFGLAVLENCQDNNTDGINELMESMTGSELKEFMRQVKTLN